MCDTCFSKLFWVPNNAVKYNSRTNPNVWLEDYRHVCRVDDDIFIIQFLPIYLVDMVKAWLDRLSRNKIDSWEDHLHWQFPEHVCATR
jgi:hypothetical protein